MVKLNSIDMAVGGRIRLRRIQRGVELGSLAAMLKIPKSRLQAFEAGRERIGASLLLEICNALAVGFTFFFEGLPTEAPAETAQTNEI